MDDEDDFHLNKKKHVKHKFDFSLSDEEDEIIFEYDVVVSNEISDTDVFRVQFPSRKSNVFDVDPRIRFKKNVKMMEMRLPIDTTSKSYDKTKEIGAGSTSSGKVKQEFTSFGLGEEVFEGRAYSNSNIVHVAGFFKDGQVVVSPISGCFDMHRSINPPNVGGNQPKDEEREFSSADESDTETKPGSQQLRVKFTRPETERQKKRREASALHRERMIASDHWIDMNVHINDPIVQEKKEQMVPRHSQLRQTETPSMREVVQEAILCCKAENLDLTRSDQLMSLQRIRELPIHLQVKAQVIKSKVISTSDVARLVDSSISRPKLMEYLKECAHVVKGVWVLQSELLFVGLPPAHSNVPGKVDPKRSQLWRDARDLALCLIGAGHRVTRNTLIKCFHLNAADAEEILSTFGIKDNRCWKLRVDGDEEFANDETNLSLLVAERSYWNNRWDELQRHLAHVL